MLANYSQHQRRNKMDYLVIGVIALALMIVFVGTQLMAILFLMSENERIQQEAEKNFPPF
jgi:Ni/Fe-hydrogenase subunit HybB-like protein